jgi:hypothetical protein
MQLTARYHHQWSLKLLLPTPWQFLSPLLFFQPLWCFKLVSTILTPKPSLPPTLFKVPLTHPPHRI